MFVSAVVAIAILKFTYGPDPFKLVTLKANDVILPALKPAAVNSDAKNKN